MMTYIVLYTSSFYHFVSQNFWLLFLLFALSAFCLILIVHEVQNITNKITYHDLKITDWMMFWVTCLTFLLLYLSFFTYRRLSNVGKSVDLKLIIYNIHSFIINNEFVTILSLIFCIIMCILLYMFIFKFLKNVIFYTFLKVHIIIMNKALEKSFFHHNWYDKIIHKALDLDYYLPEKLFKLIVFLTYRKKSGDYSDFEDKLSIKYNFYTHRDRFNLYLIFLGFLYDTLFNDLIVNKLYYILPITFIFFLLRKFINVTCFLERAECSDLYCIFYKKMIRKEGSKLIYKDEIIDYDELEDINKRLSALWEPEKPRSYYLGYTEVLKDGLFLLIFSILFFIYIFKTTNTSLELTVFKELFIINSKVIFITLIIIQTVFWLYLKNSNFFKYCFWFVTVINVILLSIMFIKHNVPLLFNEITTYANIKLIDTYTINEKIYFIKQYLKYKTYHSNNQKYLLQILDKIPLREYVKDVCFDDLREYVDNLITIQDKLEIKIDMVIDSIIKDFIDEIRKEIYNKVDNYFIIITKIKAIFIRK